MKFKQLREKFKPYNSKKYPRCVDFYIQFRGGKGDRITSPENKKDFIKATDMIDAYIKKNKIKQKPVYSTPQEGSSAYKVGLMIDSKSVDYKNGVDLQPLYVSLSKLKTAEDHGGGWDKAVSEESVNEGMYTKNDGGAFDGLRIAKYLAHEDGKSWRKLKYGETEGYLQDAATLLKKDKSKARDILSQPTPRD